MINSLFSVGLALARRIPCCQTSFRFYCFLQLNVYRIHRSYSTYIRLPISLFRAFRDRISLIFVHLFLSLLLFHAFLDHFHPFYPFASASQTTFPLWSTSRLLLLNSFPRPSSRQPPKNHRPSRSHHPSLKLPRRNLHLFQRLPLRSLHPS